MPSAETKSKEQKAAESEVESFRKDLARSSSPLNDTRDDYRTFPVFQKPFHQSELGDALAKLLTPNERSVESEMAVVAETSR